eukprot:Filipodium_phascolosomae@DN4893_c0_g1_i1.p2
MLLCATRRPERVRWLIGVAAAPDCTERLMWEHLSDSERVRAMARPHSPFGRPSPYSETGEYRITFDFIQCARPFLILDSDWPSLQLAKVYLLHGEDDSVVPLRLAQALRDVLNGGGGRRTIHDGAPAPCCSSSSSSSSSS